jgi:hypothetical protein
MTARRRLANRRPSTTFTFQCGIRRRPVYLLRLQPLRGADDIRRLRLLLKALLRRHELKCISIEVEVQR